MRHQRWLVLAALAVAAIQIGFIGWVIAGRAAILLDGREILLKVEPVDPRDLLRGDYVRLGYAITQVPSSIFDPQPAPDTVRIGDPIYVRLKPGSEGYWLPVKASFGGPPSGPRQPDEIDIKGRSESGFSPGEGQTVRAIFGIERFYLPEGEGLAIEKDMRERPFAVRVAVGSDGTAQIKAFLDGDTVLFEEPLY